MAPVVFVFLDGVGLAASGAANPLSAAPMPKLRAWLGGPMVSGAEQSHPELLLAGIDASLGVPGLPQSATGQTALFTGVNVVRRLGYHLPAFPNDALVAILNQHSIFRRAVDAGKRPTFANAYTPAYFEHTRGRNGRMSATTNMVLGSGIPFRWIRDLERGQAVTWDITGDQIRHRLGVDVPRFTPEQAGRNLSRLAQTYDLVLFESFLPDVIGHAKDFPRSLDFLEQLDRFLGAIWEYLPPQGTLIVSSDHGNFEDLSTGAHTLNPAILLVRGPGAGALAACSDLTGVAGPLLDLIAGPTDS